jgi:hypothetical protein
MKDNEKAKQLLIQAIALHQKHMDGTAPTTGVAGMASQMRMMELMKSAMRELDDGQNLLAKGLLHG